MVDSVSVRFKHVRFKKMHLNIRIQWNAGTACVSECILKTLACRGLCVGPSKFQKNPRAHNNKIGTSPTPPKTQNNPPPSKFFMPCILLGKPTPTWRIWAPKPPPWPPGQGPSEILYADFLWVFLPFVMKVSGTFQNNSERNKAHKHKLFALVNVQMALGQTAGCPRVNRAKKFMCSPRNTGNINFSLWLTGGLSQGCPDFQKVYVFKVYVPFSFQNNLRKYK